MEVHKTSAKSAQWKPVVTESKETSAPSVRQDISDISGGKTEDWDAFLKNWMASTGIQAHGVRITVVGSDHQSLLRYATTAGSGTHLLVGRDFLRAMSADGTSYKNGSDILGQVLSLLQGGTEKGAVGAQLSATDLTFWEKAAPKEPDFVSPQEWKQDAESSKRLLELMEQARREIDQIKKKFRVQINKNLYQARAEVMSRLARATTAAGVSSAVSMARRSVNTLKIALRTCDESEKKNIRAAIAGLESVSVRGARKKRALSEEQILYQRQEQAKKAQQRRKQAQLKHELEQKQAVRKVRESAQITEGMLPVPQHEYERRLKAYETSVSAEPIPVTIPTVAPVMTTAPQATPTEAPIINVAPAITISI